MGPLKTDTRKHRVEALSLSLISQSVKSLEGTTAGTPPVLPVSLTSPTLCSESRVVVFVFQIYLSWKSGPAEVKHWKDMLARPRTNVAQWHALKA